MQFSLIFHLHALTTEHLPSHCCTACCANCAAIGAVHLRRASLSRASPGSRCLAATVPGPTHSAFTMVVLGLPRSGRVLPVRHAAVHPPTQPSHHRAAPEPRHLSVPSRITGVARTDPVHRHTSSPLRGLSTFFLPLYASMCPRNLPD